MSGIRRKLRVMAVVTAATLASIGVLGISSPAQADENGSEWCDMSTGSISVTTAAGQSATTVLFGTELAVSWSVNASCPDFNVYVFGPGFSYEPVGHVGTRYHIWATPPAGSNTLGWSVGGIGMMRPTRDSSPSQPRS
jgi:hypothetical protein